jgi:hypothetical protein
MAEQSDNKDALLEKLDNLMRSGRAPKRNDPPPVLTDTIPGASESSIPTLTDVVSAPETAPRPESSANTDATGQEDAPLEFETSSPDDADRHAPLEFERIEVESGPQQGAGDLEQQEPAEVHEPAAEDSGPEATDNTSQETPTVLHESISARLLDVLDEEMAQLLKELPAEKSRLSVLHRSLRFALPELVRLRWLEPTNGGLDEDSSDGDPEQER